MHWIELLGITQDYTDRVLCTVSCDLSQDFVVCRCPQVPILGTTSLGAEGNKESVAGFPGIKEAHVLGRVLHHQPTSGRMQLLLHHIRGPQSFTQLKTVEGDLCSSFREACFRLGLLEDDNQYHLAMQEASVSNSAASLRSLFAVILTWCEPSNPLDIYEQHKESMAEDFLHQQRTRLGNSDLGFNDDIFN